LLVVLGPWHGIGASDGLAQAACLLATFCYGLAFVCMRRFVAPYRLPALSVATVQVSLGAVVMAVLAPVYLTGTARLGPAVTASVGSQAHVVVTRPMYEVTCVAGKWPVTWSGWPDLNRRPLRPELRAQANKSPGLGHFRTSDALRRLRLRRLTASDRS
jgi:hypothetical protein